MTQEEYQKEFWAEVARLHVTEIGCTAEYADWLVANEKESLQVYQGISPREVFDSMCSRPAPKRWEPRFGIKDYKVVEKVDWDDPAAGGEGQSAVQKVLEVEFLNGNVYHSQWTHDIGGVHCPRGVPSSGRIKPVGAYGQPVAEVEMEMFVVEHLCHAYFDPSHQEPEKPQPKDDWDVSPGSKVAVEEVEGDDFVCDGNYTFPAKGIFMD